MTESVRNAANIAAVVILVSIGGMFYLKSTGPSAAPDAGPVVVDTSIPSASGPQVEIQPENVGQTAAR